MSTTKKIGFWFLAFFIAGLFSLGFPFEEDNILYHLSGLFGTFLISISFLIFIAFVIFLLKDKYSK
jgi:hypothetical protein